MAEHHWMGKSKKEMIKMIGRVSVVRIKSIVELKRLLLHLDILVAESSAALVIWDSIASLICEKISCSKTYYKALYDVTEKLTFISKYHNIPILVTNQTLKKINRSQNALGTPLLGYLWSYCCNIKLMVQLIDATKDIHKMVVLKNPLSAESSFSYTIQSSGLNLYDHDS
jgi:RecA/RadA recombinase